MRDGEGFALVEILISVVLGVIAFVAIYSALIYGYKRGFYNWLRNESAVIAYDRVDELHVKGCDADVSGNVTRLYGNEGVLFLITTSVLYDSADYKIIRVSVSPDVSVGVTVSCSIDTLVRCD